MPTPFDPQSLAFFLAESRDVPIHVGGLLLFEKPADAGEDYVREVYEDQLKVDRLRPLFAKRPLRSLGTAGQWMWVDDDEFDIEHHVRRSALPSPGRIRELLDLTSRLHGQRMAADRPLWETWVIEGLDDGRLAMYTKIHHALVDGVSAMRLLASAFSPDPDERGMVPPFAWTEKAPRPDRTRPEQVRAMVGVTPSALRSAIAVARDAAGLPRALAKSLANAKTLTKAGPISLRAPRTMINQKISGARRFAADDWDMARLKAVGEATGTTLNDVLLAMCGGALRTYLLEHDGLPNTSLISAVPVGLNAKDAGVASGDGGNAVGFLMVRLGTDEADPLKRLQDIHESMQGGKEMMSTMTRAQIIATGALGIGPSMLLPLLGLSNFVNLPFNVTISNVPGPKVPMYFNGAKLVGMYPASIPMHGQGLNITAVSYAGQLGIGLTGCRKTVPSLQRLLIHLEDALVELEKAAGV
jgi:diacylglycerol O-acyltransferase